MIILRLTRMQHQIKDRGFKKENAVYVNPYTIADFIPTTEDSDTTQIVSASLVYLTTGKSYTFEESPEQILAMIHLATRRKIPQEVAYIDREQLAKFLAEKGLTDEPR